MRAEQIYGIPSPHCRKAIAHPVFRPSVYYPKMPKYIRNFAPKNMDTTFFDEHLA